MLQLPNQQTVKGIIFDLNGTMVDDMMIHHRAWQRKLAQLGLDMTLEEVRQRIHGINEEIIARNFPGRFSPEEVRQIAWEKEAEYREIFRPELKLIDGLPEFLHQLNLMEIPKGIGTAAPKENLDFVMDELELRGQFPTLIHSGDVIKGKPDPEVFELVAQGIGVPLADCLIFEDSPTGAEASFRGGAKTIVITTTHTVDEFSHLDNVVAAVNDYTRLQLTQTNKGWQLELSSSE